MAERRTFTHEYKRAALQLLTERKLSVPKHRDSWELTATSCGSGGRSCRPALRRAGPRRGTRRLWKKRICDCGGA
jgi:hypothetical protein